MLEFRIWIVGQTPLTVFSQGKARKYASIAVHPSAVDDRAGLPSGVERSVLVYDPFASKPRGRWCLQSYKVSTKGER